MAITRTDQQVGTHDVEVTERRTWISPGRVLAALLGIGLAFTGAVAMIKSGVDADLVHPMTTVWGIPHSALIGLIELVAGVLIVLSSFTEADRVLAGVVGVLFFIAGIMAVASTAQTQRDVGFGTSTGWFFVVIGLVAVVAAVLPSMLTVRRDVRDID
jgi:uncharacterized membrane protein HdeD (DUF308 family)